MWSPEFCIRAYRKITSRRAKAAAVTMLRWLGLRYLVVRLDTTNVCNLRCRMCYYSSAESRTPEMMDAELFQKVAEEMFPRARFLYLSCATEPLMNRQFPEFLEIAGRYHVPFTSFCTNGMLLNEKVIDAAIGSRLSEIIFSVDGASAETYEYIRRGANWKRLLEKIRLLQRMKQESGAARPVTRINFTCMERNVRELPQLIRLAEEYGVENIHVRHLLAFGQGGGEMKYQEQAAYCRSFNTVAAESQQEARRLGVQLFLPDDVQEQHQSRATARREANPYCLIPWFQAIINSRGDYRLCSAFPAMGNLREQSFKEVYHGQVMRQLRRALVRRSEGACSWDCIQEAYDAKEEHLDDAPELVGDRLAERGTADHD